MLNEKKIVFLFTKKNFIVKDKKKSFINIFFLLEFGRDKLTSFISSLVIKLDFYKPTVLKFHPPFSRITAYATMPG